MSTTIVSADTVLAIDVGSVKTRAILFDVVEGRYRFLACGTAQSTIGAPSYNLIEGVRQAINLLQTTTGRTLLGVDEMLIVPSQSDGSGVDRCVATLSGGPTLKALVVGLLEEVSVRSAMNLVSTTYARIQGSINLNDRCKTEERIDKIIHARPDLIVMAGGTEDGATQSVQTLLEPVGLACYLMPQDQRPQVLFAGNQALAEDVKMLLGSLVNLQIAPNIRPALETENLLPAQKKLAHAYRALRYRQIQGTEDLDRWTGGDLLPTAMALGRTIRFISKEYEKTSKGVLGVDVGASSTTIAAGFAGKLNLTVHPNLGMGKTCTGVLDTSSVEEVSRWIPLDIDEDIVRDYIYNKSLQPASIPATEEDLAIEQAVATQTLRTALKTALRNFPEPILRTSGGRLPAVEPIIATGSVLSEAPLQGQTLMMLLNALQPGGLTTLAVDKNNLMAAIGAAAESTPLLTIQSLDASNFVNLCTVITPIGRAPLGTSILRVKIGYSEGDETTVDVKNGTMEMVPIPFGQVVNLQLQPLHKFDVGMGGAGRGGSVKINGGLMGLVIDARGRPLRLPEDPFRRLELLQKWFWTVSS